MVAAQNSLPAVVAALRDVQELGTDVQLKSLQVILVMVTQFPALKGQALFEVRPPTGATQRRWSSRSLVVAAAAQGNAAAGHPGVLPLAQGQGGDGDQRGGSLPAPDLHRAL